MSKFNIGDKVVRVKHDNGTAARIGQVATVVGLDNHKGPPPVISWDESEYESNGYVDDFNFALVYRRLGPCGRVRYSTWTLVTQVPYGEQGLVGDFKTREAAKKFAEDEASDLKILGKFKGGMK